MLAGILWLGLYPNPVLKRIEPAATRYLERIRGEFGAFQYSKAAPTDSGSVAPPTVRLIAR
jgi:hypothetical protein